MMIQMLIHMLEQLYQLLEDLIQLQHKRINQIGDNQLEKEECN